MDLLNKDDTLIKKLFSFFSQKNWQSVNDCKLIGEFIFSFCCSDLNKQEVFDCWQKECKAFSKTECQELWLDQFPLSAENKTDHLYGFCKILRNNDFNKYFELVNTDSNFRVLDITFKMVHYTKEKDFGKVISMIILALNESSNDGPEKDKIIRELEEQRKNLETREIEINYE